MKRREEAGVARVGAPRWGPRPQGAGLQPPAPVPRVGTPEGVQTSWLSGKA